MPAPLKPRNRRQRQRPRHGPRLTIESGTKDRQPAAIPDPPTGLLAAIRDQWLALWGSPLADAIDPVTDLPAVVRLFTLRDERERAYRAYRKKRLVRGSKGQPVLNPVWRQVPVMDAEIRQLEDRLGLTAKARAQLGIQMGTPGPDLDDLARDMDDDDDGHEDPRLTAAR